MIDMLLKECVLCPRRCHADRMSGARGVCGEGAMVRVARASLHMWEEPCISGAAGSGTVFFSGCPLKCAYCQNRAVSSGQKGDALTIPQLAALFLLLQDKGAVNINLVTPTHFSPQIAEAIKTARAEGLRLPVVYNSSGYESVDALRMLDGLIDVYLPDLKYHSDALAARYSGVPDYFAHAAAALREMARQVGRPVFTEEGLMERGMIVRHMVLPGNTIDSKKVIGYLYGTYGDDIYMSIMDQYTPPPGLKGFQEIARKVTLREYEKVVDYALAIGVRNAFIQEGGTAEESFIPDFDDSVFLREILG